VFSDKRERMRITIAKEIEVELPNGFYWDETHKHAYWVTDSKILEFIVGNSCFSAELVSESWAHALAQEVWRAVYKNPVQTGNKQLEEIAKKVAEMYGLI